MLRVTAAEKYKGMTRISFIAGRRCLNEDRMLRENGEAISRALKVPLTETARAVSALLEKAAKLEENLKSYEEAAAETKALEILAKAGQQKSSGDEPVFYAECFPDADMEKVLAIGKQLQKRSPAVFVLGSAKDAKFAALCSAKGADIRPRLKEALEKAGGRGGGGPGFFQGQFASAKELENFIGLFTP
jgi:alanyl-tRNA synthetase